MLLIQKRSMKLSKTPLLQLENLSIGIKIRDQWHELTEGLNLSLYAGEVLGLVGESGCGKSITCLSILQLLPRNIFKRLAGRILWQGRDISALAGSELRLWRAQEVNMIFQEPSSALNPLIPIGKQILERGFYHSKKIQQRDVEEILERVGLKYALIKNAYPFELSGGMQQRVMIAMALVLKPALLIADEPTTALDVTIQAQIMELLSSLQKEYGMSLLLVTHHLALVAQYAQRMAVMYAGRIVEEGPCREVLQSPLHPYTRGLLEALPDLGKRWQHMKAITGQVPAIEQFAQHCRFYERCPQKFAACLKKPEWTLMPSTAVGQAQRGVACFAQQGKGAQHGG